jgi:hypothetical protein
MRVDNDWFSAEFPGTVKEESFISDDAGSGLSLPVRLFTSSEDGVVGVYTVKITALPFWSQLTEEQAAALPPILIGVAMNSLLATTAAADRRTLLDETSDVHGISTRRLVLSYGEQGVPMRCYAGIFAGPGFLLTMSAYVTDDSEGHARAVRFLDEVTFKSS